MKMTTTECVLFILISAGYIKVTLTMLWSNDDFHALLVEKVTSSIISGTGEQMS
jgi:hypothetical protein